jgi:hypothetical protein
LRAGHTRNRRQSRNAAPVDLPENLCETKQPGPEIHPAYAEVAKFLSTQMADEARHIDVFLKRARAAGGGLGVSSVTTSQSLLSLLELADFSLSDLHTSNFM